MSRDQIRWYFLVACFFCWLSCQAYQCPSHYDLREYAQLSSMEYFDDHAMMNFSVQSHHTRHTLYFKLPAHPPFTRPISHHYVSHSYGLNRGHVNWGYTEYYKHDLSRSLLRYIAFRGAYTYGHHTDCLYLSVIENNWLYGHIWSQEG